MKKEKERKNERKKEKGEKEERVGGGGGGGWWERERKAWYKRWHGLSEFSEYITTGVTPGLPYCPERDEIHQR